MSKISLGTSLYGSILPDSQEESELEKVIKKSLESGINFIDTGRSYLGGRCEAFLGKVLSKPEMLQYDSRIATKIHFSNYKETIDEVERSRKELHRDCIDVMYIHWPKSNTDMRPMMEALEECRRRKWIKEIGVSNFTISQLDSVREVGHVDLVQLGYNLLWRIHEKDLIPYCKKNKIGLITYSSLAQGILSGKFPLDVNFNQDDFRRGSIFFDKKYWPSVFHAVEEMKNLAKKENCSLIELALNWLMEKEDILSIVVGAKNLNQLETILASTKKSHSSVMEELTEISNQIFKILPDKGNIFQKIT